MPRSTSILTHNFFPDNSGKVTVSGMARIGGVATDKQRAIHIPKEALNMGFHGGFVVPKDYKGSPFIEIIWMSTGPSSGSVTFGMEYQVVVPGSATSLAGNANQPALSSYIATTADAFEPVTTAIAMPGLPIEGSFIQYYFYRDGAANTDTHPYKIIIVDVRFRYSTEVTPQPSISYTPPNVNLISTVAVPTVVFGSTSTVVQPNPAVAIALRQAGTVNISGGGGTITCSSAPTLNAVWPRSVAIGTTKNITLTGDQFATGMSVTIPGVTVNSVTVDSSTQATVSVTTPGSVSTVSGIDSKNITVSTSCGTDTIVKGFHIGLLAFPWASGFASGTIGGRGGQVIAVTSLADSGPGTLREAVTTPGPRIVIFKVAGIISADSPIEVTQPYCTILGQTSPGQGITIKNSSVNKFQSMAISADQVIVQCIRVRCGDDGGASQNGDSLFIIESQNILIDHCSFSWGSDEICDTFTSITGTGENEKITFQNCIIAHGLYNSVHPEGTHGYGFLMGRHRSGHINIERCLFADSFKRHPRAQMGRDHSEFRNNLIFDDNWGAHRSLLVNSGGGRDFNFVGNVYLAGTGGHNGRYEIAFDDSGAGFRVYCEDNIGPHRSNGDPESDILKDAGFYHPTEFENPSTYVNLPSGDVETYVKANAGCQWFNGNIGNIRDAIDQLVVNQVTARVGGLIDTPEDDGGYVSMTQGPAMYSSRPDNIPDAWKTANGYLTSVDYTGYTDPVTGYDLVEVWAHELTGFEYSTKPMAGGGGGGESATIEDDSDGENWGISALATRAPNTGLSWFPETDFTNANTYNNDVYGIAGNAYTTVRHAGRMQIRWSEIETSEGVYDWSVPDAKLAQYQANNKAGVGFFIIPRMYGTFIPAWVSAKYSANFSNNPADFWNKTTGASYSYNIEAAKFIEKIVQRYAGSPYMAMCDMMTPWSAAFGEWNIPGGLPSGSTNGDLIAFTNAYYDTWVAKWDAGGLDRKKLVARTSSRSFGGLTVHEYAKSLGLGTRDGLPEAGSYWEAYDNCNIVNDRIVPNESGHWANSLATTYSEATEIDLTSSQHGPEIHSYERFIIMLTWMLSVRRRWAGVANQLYEPIGGSFYNGLSAELKYDFIKMKQMVTWMTVNMGHTASSASEAFSFLNETTYGGTGGNLFWCGDNYGTDVKVINVERWLYQKDVAGNGVTTPAFITPTSEIQDNAREKYLNVVGSNAEQYKARQFSTNMYFVVEPTFLSGGPHEIDLKITYYDKQTSAFYVEYSDGTTTQVTPTQATTGSGHAYSDWRTVTFRIPGMYFDQSFSNGMDFRLVKASGSDPIIRFARLLKV